MSQGIKCLRTLLDGLGADGSAAINPMRVVVVAGYEVAAAQTAQARTSCDHPDIRIGHRCAEIPATAADRRR
jgi:hypothetical protein